MSTKNKKNPADCDGTVMPLPHKLTKLFWVLAPGFTRWAESHMHEKGLTPQRLRILWPLIENGSMMMSALRDELGVSATNITALVDALEKDRMVTRKAHATDRRATMIAITPKAEKILTENCGEFRDRVAGIFSDFSNSQQEQLMSLLLKMRDALIERHVLEESDHCGGAKVKNTPPAPTRSQNKKQPQKKKAK